MTDINPSIFREYDIRGIWGSDLTPEVIRSIGRAFAVCLGKTTGKDRLKITVGRDVRLSSPEIYEILASSLVESGVDVVNIGACPTPVQYFSLFKLPVDGGIMITGSHNPSEFNGMKISMGRETIFGDGIQAIRRTVEKGKTISGSGAVESFDIIPAYIEHIKNEITNSCFSAKACMPFEGIKVVIDAGNGTGGLVAPRLLRDLGCEVVELYCEPDGRFPNHHPDPVVLENIEDLRAAVKNKKAHLGIGYDGDSDRIGVVDEDGEIVWGDRLLIIFAREVLKSKQGATVIGEVKCSRTLYDDIKARGGNSIMWKTGHSLIKNKMKETNALLAGEMSGHMFFADRYFGYDDAIYAGARLVEIMSKNGKPYSLKKLLSGIPVTASTPEIRFDCPDEIKFKVVEKIKESFKGHAVIDIDGMRVEFPDGWGLIRASNTQPALVLRFEARDDSSLQEIKNLVESKLGDAMKCF